MLGQNGTGKTTFIRMLAGLAKPDGDEEVPKLNVSYKPQKIAPKFQVKCLPGTIGDRMSRNSRREPSVCC